MERNLKMCILGYFGCDLCKSGEIQNDSFIFKQFLNFKNLIWSKAFDATSVVCLTPPVKFELKSWLSQKCKKDNSGWWGEILKSTVGKARLYIFKVRRKIQSTTIKSEQRLPT